MSLKELVFSHNSLSQVKELTSLKRLSLLDLSFNKIIDFEKVTALQSLKKIKVLCLNGNLLEKTQTYDQTMARMFPWIKITDP